MWKHFFHNSNVTHGHTNNYQVTLTFMEKLGNSLNNTEKMKVEEQGLFEFWKCFSIKQQHIESEYNNGLDGNTKQPSLVTPHIYFF